ncbi:MAG: hypothetical protein IKZ87_06595 [Actinomycetaceae bacterium]|nr:hypothetical protein [Actinomycetaceae bacterium]
MKSIKAFITRVFAQFNNKKSTAMENKQTEFMKAAENAFKQLAEIAKTDDNKAVVMIAIDKAADGKTGTMTAVCGTGDRVIKSIFDAMGDEHAGKLFREANKRYALAQLLKVLSK